MYRSHSYGGKEYPAGRIFIEVFMFVSLFFTSIALMSGWTISPILSALFMNPFQDFRQLPSDVPQPSSHGSPIRFSACHTPPRNGEVIQGVPFSLCFGQTLCSEAYQSWSAAPWVLHLPVARMHLDHLMGAVTNQFRDEATNAGPRTEEEIEREVMEKVLDIPLVCDRVGLTDEEMREADTIREHMLQQGGEGMENWGKSGAVGVQ